jgi:hypothetical protein
MGARAMEGSAFLRSDAAGEPTAQRVDSILRVAGAHGTGVPLRDLAELLPLDGPRSETDLADWMREHPSLGHVVGRTAFPAGSSGPGTDLDDRRARGARYWEAAEGLVAGPLRAARPLLRSLAVTGSTAYGEPEEGDDLDFLAVTRASSVWVFLTYSYLRLRLRGRPRDGSADPTPCFNYVLDETAARREFTGSRGLLFAREALTARPVLGRAFYRDLVGSAAWMEGELPRLYARWSSEPSSASPVPAPTPWPLRLLNGMLFPPVAAYLQLQCLLRNRALRRSGRGDEAFRTVAEYRGLRFVTDRFERLRHAHESAARAEGASA